MKEVERKDLPGISGGQAGTTNPVTIIPVPNTPAFPGVGQTDDPFDPLGDGSKRQQQSYPRNPAGPVQSAASMSNRT